MADDVTPPDAAGAAATPEPAKKKSFQEFIQGLNKREKMLSYIAGFIILLVMLDKMILSPIINRIKSIEEQTEQQISVVRDGLMIIGYRDVIREEFDMFKRYFLDQRKTQEEELAEFLKDMETRAMQAGIHLITISPTGDVEEAKNYSRYEVKLDCSGTMEQLITFMYELSFSRQPTKIEDFDLLPPSKGGEEVKCAFSISRIFVMA